MSRAHRHYMAMALRLAARGRGRTSPNPMVGAVVVRDGEVVGRGYHRVLGGPHAEVEALREAGAGARGATVYVTLEPCCHHGRTPPCTEALLEAGVARVVAAMQDPNPLVAGQGFATLREAGVDVSVGESESAARHLNRGFVTLVTEQRPWVTLKLAASLDGRIAAAGGDARWISSPDSRQRVHRMRGEHDAVLVGAGTQRADDPALTARRADGTIRRRQPRRVVFDGRLTTLPTAQILGAGGGPTTVVTVEGASEERARQLRDAGAEILRVAATPDALERVDVLAALRGLGNRGIASVLVEGGAQLAAALLSAGLVDELVAFVAPKLIGGDGVPMLGALGVTRVAEAPELDDVRVRRSGGDLVVTGRPRRAPRS